MTGTITLMLLYEPSTSKQGPVPLARVEDADLALQVARSAITQAETRASKLASVDEFLGEAEFAETRRLRDVLALLIPGVAADKPIPAVVQ